MKDRKLLMIPGPIEFTPEVLRAMGMPTTSHVAPNFIEVFGQALERLRQVFLSSSGQPFIVAGSGTLAMDIAAANLVEPGDKALVVDTGYFSERFTAILERYGATVTPVRAPVVGDAPSLEDVEAELKKDGYKLMTVTHVDTSTAVRADVKALTALGRKYGALVVVDGVCAVAGEEMRQDEWGIDLALTASQKAIGTPPGLALVVAGPRAMEAFRKRKTPVGNYYADWTNWLPIMEAYEARRPSYFGTPAVNLIWALNVSLGQILEEGMEARFARHRKLNEAFKAAIRALGLKQVPVSSDREATTLTAPYYPDGVDSTVLKRINEAGVILAGGLHPAIKDRYFRVGHMGAVSASDILTTVGAIEKGLAQAGYKFEPGAGLAAAQAILTG
ncbi:MAG: alanine--glyoxylate aminotransferase family protein [Anaerolineae bacterium]|jgi:alanine-glyoxylate transaminase/serine-glyoxylate transaminase/serine-pyruvate transaminase|nr:alanine--glyoxylate aminotransferase family protein [Anaerolineae bacterium]MDH7475666.1 alanine--glyoxylate aminotransferase family protein [Anaerolineae bacterium]